MTKITITFAVDWCQAMNYPTQKGHLLRMRLSDAVAFNSILEVCINIDLDQFN